MRITNQIEVAQSPEKVWELFGDIPQVAACLPGTRLTGQEGDDHFTGEVAIKAGPVSLEFDGTAEVLARDDDARTMKVEAQGADRKGRGQATLLLDAAVSQAAGGTVVDTALDLTLSGPAAQYGRGMVNDVTTVLLEEFGSNLQARLTAIEQGLDPDEAVGTRPASGASFAFRAARIALARVLRRFFLPYRPQPTRR